MDDNCHFHGMDYEIMKILGRKVFLLLDNAPAQLQDLELSNVVLNIYQLTPHQSSSQSGSEMLTGLRCS